MRSFKRHVNIDCFNFNSEVLVLKALYGLPQKVGYCKRCLISNQRLNAVLSEFNLEFKREKKTIGFDGLGG